MMPAEQFGTPDLDLRWRRQSQMPGNLRQMGAVGRYVPTPPAGSQRVIITGVITTKVQTAKNQLRYMQYGRAGDAHGKGRDGQPAYLFGPGGRVSDTAQFLTEAQRDPHQFRIMVSPERVPHYFMLRPFIEQLMAQVARDTGRSLDWLASVHYDTPRTHAHILLRGRDTEGQALYLTKNYRQQGIRYRAMALATQWMGWTHERTPERELRQESERELRQESERELSVRARRGTATRGATY